MAFSALALACEGTALGIVEASVTEDLPNRSAPLAWANLCCKYEPATRMSAVALNKQFGVCKLEDMDTDPETWVQELNVSPQNAVTDKRMIAHILANLLEEYSELITTIESELDRPGEDILGLDKLLSCLCRFYCHKFEDKKEARKRRSGAHWLSDTLKVFVKAVGKEATRLWTAPTGKWALGAEGVDGRRTEATSRANASTVEKLATARLIVGRNRPTRRRKEEARETIWCYVQRTRARKQRKEERVPSNMLCAWS